MNDDEADDWPTWLMIITVVALLFIGLIAAAVGLAALSLI